MGAIKRLPPLLVNQIAAGEVVERPGSVVKELLENAVDAGADRIEVELERGGCDLIRVADNGCGIAQDDLPLALEPHATSKLSKPEDLTQILTMGFRGEALASIASVSRVRIESRLPEAEIGYSIEAEGGRIGPVRACGCPPGTMVEVRDLFFNVPARRKFLKTPQTELGHAVEAFTRVALSHPNIYLKLAHNSRPLYELPPTEQLIQRLALFFGRELVEQLIWIEAESEGYRLWGYVGHPSLTRPNTRGQYFFVNRRYVRDRVFAHALAEAYRGLVMTGRHPVAFLFLDLPPEQVDVNVHPTKIEVRFRDSQRVYSLVLGTLRDRFLKTDLTAPFRLDAPAAEFPGTEQQPSPSETVLDSVRQYFERCDRTDRPQPFTLRRPSTPPRHLDLPPPPPGVQPRPLSRPAHADPAPINAMQIHNAYLVVETDDGLMVIDQHALHERILYEELRERVERGSVESQKLLVPQPVQVTPLEEAALDEHRDLIRKLGLELEHFGPRTVAVRAYPALLRKADPTKLAREVLQMLAEKGRQLSARELLDELLHTMACRSAVKAGDPLTDEEIRELLRRRELARDHHHCPHGRPTALVLTREELDRRFGRR